MTTKPRTATADERAAILALSATSHIEPHLVTRLIEQSGDPLTLLHSDPDAPELDLRHHPLDRKYQQLAGRLARHTDRDALGHYRDLLDRLAERGIRMITPLDHQEYLFDLRDIPNRPPFVFLQGTLTDRDELGVAIAGDEADTPDWVADAQTFAGELAAAGETIIAETGRITSDAALTAALDAGGRAVGILDHGIVRQPRRCAPALAARLVDHGALVSSCWPDQPPTETSRGAARDLVCGLAAVTLVTGGAAYGSSRRQARRALEQHQQLLLTQRLVQTEPWAAHYAEHPAATVVHTTQAVLDRVAWLARMRPGPLDHPLWADTVRTA